MASLTQTTPYYIQGISQQPDSLKKTGQVRKALNVVPDITEGLVKRPGGQHVKNLSAVNASGSAIDLNSEAAWFAVDQPTKYIGRVHTDGTFAVWETASGNQQNVSYSANNQPGSCGCAAKYLAHTDPESIQFLTINDHTFVVNREKTTSMLAVNNCRYASSSYPTYTNPNRGRPYEAFIELKKVSHKQEYPLDISTTSPAPAGTNNTRATKLKAIWLTGSGGSQASLEIRGVGSTKYTYTKTFDINPSPTPTGGTTHTGTNSTQRNLRFKLKMTGMPYSEGTDYHSVYRLEWDLLHGGYGWKVGDFFEVSMGDTGSTGYFRIYVTETEPWNSTADIGIIRPMPTSSDANTIVNTDTVLEQLKNEINAKTSNYFTITKIGNGLHLQPASGAGSGCRTYSKFNITTSEETFFNILTSECSDISELPSQCQDGYLVKVVNSVEDEDDHWLKFVSDTPGKGGAGHWEETYDPCVELDFDPCTMPHILVRQSSGTWDLQTIPWEPRRVGDDVTNEIPSFIGEAIYNISFFRNRLGFLSKENMIFSQAGDHYNFWSESAMEIAEGDPIDITADSDRPTLLHDAIEVNQGLVVFSQFQQFMVTTDTDSFGPETAKVNNLSSYDFNTGVKPFPLANDVGFTSNSGLNAKMWHMGSIQRDGPPAIIEQSKSIGNSLPTNLLTAATSRDNNLVLLAGWDPTVQSYAPCPDPYSTIWGFKYFHDGREFVQAAWFKWNVYGKMVWHTIMDNTYYGVVHYNNQAHLLAFDLQRQQATFTVNDTNVCEHSRVHLDNANYVEFGGGYDPATNLTAFTLPDNHRRQPSTHGQASGGSQVVYGVEGNYKGKVHVVKAFTANAVTTAYVEGNWQGQVGVLGFTYDMEVEFPVIYFKKPGQSGTVADLTSQLTVHRSQFSLGPSGYFSTVLKRKGRTDYVQNFNASTTHTFNLNQYNILLDQEITVPIYAKNKDYLLSILATHPTPCTIYSQTWEGDYIPKLYKRG